MIKGGNFHNLNIPQHTLCLLKWDSLKNLSPYFCVCRHVLLRVHTCGEIRTTLVAILTNTIHLLWDRVCYRPGACQLGPASLRNGMSLHPQCQGISTVPLCWDSLVGTGNWNHVCIPLSRELFLSSPSSSSFSSSQITEGGGCSPLGQSALWAVYGDCSCPSTGMAFFYLLKVHVAAWGVLETTLTLLQRAIVNTTTVAFRCRH